jgi:hypothetical protein
MQNLKAHVFPSCTSTKILYAFLISPIGSIRLPYLAFLYLITLIIFDEEYKAPDYVILSSILYFLILRFKYSPETQYNFFPWLTDHVSYPHKRIGNIIIDRKREDKGLWTEWQQAPFSSNISRVFFQILLLRKEGSAYFRVLKNRYELTSFLLKTLRTKWHIQFCKKKSYILIFSLEK